MKPQHGFIAERAAAQHCEALLRSTPKADPLIAFARFGERLAEVLPSALAPWHGALPPVVACGSPRECDAAELGAAIGSLASNCLVACAAHGHPLLLSIGAPAVFSLIDRAFGGRGAVPDPLPGAFPGSGDVLIQRIELLIAERIGIALEQAVRPLQRDTSFARLTPFAPACRVATLDIAISGDRALENWSFTIAAPLESISHICGDGGHAAKPPRAPSAADPAAEPFGAVPLYLCAVLVETQVPVSALAALEVGSVLPVAVARRVPLRIGGRTIAHGTVGELDDRAALQISSLA